MLLEVAAEPAATEPAYFGAPTMDSADTPEVPLAMLKVGMVCPFLRYLTPEWVMWVLERNDRVGEWAIKENV